MEKKIVVDIEALRNKAGKTIFSCSIEECDRGDFRTKKGICRKCGWCPHMQYPYSIELEPASTGVTIKALEKIYRAGWEISIWSSKSKRHYVKILDKLQNMRELWALLSSERSLLMNENYLGDDKIKAKLLILETEFGSTIDNGQPLVGIEHTKEWAKLLQEYTGDRVIFHSVPEIWQDILALDIDKIDGYLLRSPATVI